MTRKSLIVWIAIIALVAGGALAVVAQDDTENPVPFARGWMHHQDEDFGQGMMRGQGRMMGEDFGLGMMWGDGEPMMLAIAEALGLEPDALYTALRDGQTLAEIAEAQGVELETVYAVRLAHATEQMAELVAAGTITQAQADEHLAWVTENNAQMPLFSCNGAGQCMGGQANFGEGMMGRGHNKR